MTTTGARRASGAAGRGGPGGMLASLLCALLLLGASTLARPGAAAADEYLLGPQDRIRMRVHEWRPSQDEVRAWTALNDEFTVAADGTLSLPLVGTVEAAGKGLGALRAIVAARLSGALALPAEPDVSIEMAQYRPFYVAGAVEAPGEYAWRPGLTAIQALALAGGATLGTDDDARPVSVISRRAEVGLLSSEEVALLAKKARLLSERDGRGDLLVPEALSAHPDGALTRLAVEQERAILDARRDALRTQVEALQGLRRFLEGETTSLTAQIDLLDQQVESVEVELADLERLVEQGLAVASRQTALERALLQTQSDRLTAQTSLLRARQELSRVDLSILERQSARAADVSTELRQTDAELDRVRQRRNEALLLLADAEGVGLLAAAPTDAATGAPTGDAVATEIRILRPTDGAAAELVATPTTPVEPGDTIRVDIVLP